MSHENLADDENDQETTADLLKQMADKVIVQEQERSLNKNNSKETLQSQYDSIMEDKHETETFGPESSPDTIKPRTKLERHIQN